MPSFFENARPWFAGISHVLFFGMLAAGPILNRIDEQYLGEALATYVLWILVVVLTTMAPAERAGFFVRHGAFLWVGSLLVSFPAGFLLAPWYSDQTGGSPAYLATFWSVLALVMHLVALSAIHIARFHIPRIRNRGQGNELVIRPRRGGRLALGLRIAGMLFLAAAVVDVLWAPIIVISDPSASDYLHSLWLAGGMALVGAGLLYVSRFVADLGKGKVRVVVEPPQD